VSLDTPTCEAFVYSYLALASGIGVGMLVSATVRTEVTAISTLPLLLLPQLMLAGYLQLYRNMGGLLQTLSAFLPVRWAFEALLGLEYTAHQRVVATNDPFYDLECTIGFHGSTWVAPTVLAAVVVGSLAATWLRLRFTSLSSAH
jgi:hypothetical protein